MSLPRALVVDDEPDIRELVREILEDEGFDVTIAENAASARESCSRRSSGQPSTASVRRRSRMLR